MKVFSKIVSVNRWLSLPLVKMQPDLDAQFVQLVSSAAKRSGIILELGGVSRPVMQQNNHYTYIGIDIDDKFIHDQFYDRFYCQSVEDEIPVKADLIFSKYLMEHVKDVKRSYENQLTALKNGGKIIHLYPLGYHPFSLLNKMIGNRLARLIIPIIRPGVEGVTGYPAFYSLGNAYHLESFFRTRNGFKVEYKYFYGAIDYFGFFYPFAVIMSLFNYFVKTFGIKFFASNVIIVITKENINED
jgi:SAM-dependent methyltransferase